MSKPKIYAPAADRLADALPVYEDAKAEFYRLHTARYLEMTKAKLMETGLVSIHESYTKPEVVENAVDHLWFSGPKYQAFTKLEDAAEAEQKILYMIGRAQEQRDIALNAVREVAAKYGQPTMHIRNLRDCMALLQRNQVEFDLWGQVEALIGPEVLTPIEALRMVIFEAVNRALDDLEDNTTDLANARIRARWVRRSSDIIGMKELGS